MIDQISIVNFIYLAFLLVTIGCLVLVDYKYKLAFWRNSKAAALTLLCGVAIFSAWDLLGIGKGIFFNGNSRFDLPFMLLPNFPIEELCFLTVLSYSALLLFLGMQKYEQVRRSKS